MDQLDELANELAQAVRARLFIEVEASGRHVHLSREAVDVLFGAGHQLTTVKELSQPGQFACQERVTLHGPKGSLTRVVVLGPERSESQVEVSQTDALALGIKAPVRQSGDTRGSAPIGISTERARLELNQGAIIASRHVHMTPEDAQRYGLKDGDLVSVRVYGKRPLTFAQTLVRVGAKFRTRMHIDYDEANACGFTEGTLGLIIKEQV